LPPLRAAVSEAANAALTGEPSPDATRALAEAVGLMRAACRRRALDDAR
nr:hypothetical protein [Thermoleophilaceae bacterium]